MKELNWFLTNVDARTHEGLPVTVDGIMSGLRQILMGKSAEKAIVEMVKVSERQGFAPSRD